MLVALDSDIETSTIKEVRYLDKTLTVSKIGSLEDKVVYRLKSNETLKVPVDYVKTQKNDPEARQLQNLFHLYNIPQDAGGMLEFLFSPVQSVITMQMLVDYSDIYRGKKKFDTDNPDQLHQVFNHLIQVFPHQNIHYHEVKPIKMSDDKKKQKSRTTLKEKIFKSLVFMYLNYSQKRWFWVKDYGERNEITKRINIEKTESSTNWEEFMKIFIDILNSESVLKYRTQLPREFPKLTENPKFFDWTYPWENFITGVDDKIYRLNEIIAEERVKQFDILLEFIVEKHNISDSQRAQILKKKKEEFISDDIAEKIIMLKKIICLYSFYLNRSLSLVPPTVTLGCTATVVSSNTVITAAHCIQSIIQSGGKITANVEGLLTSDAVAYYSNPKYVRDNGTSGYDIAIVRFPDDTFKDVVQSKVNIHGNHDSVTLVGTQGKSTLRKIIIMDKKNNDNDPRGLLYKYKSYKSTRPGDSGSPIFNIDDDIVAVLSGGSNSCAPLENNMDFIELVTRIDPKVKIRGVNIE